MEAERTRLSSSEDAERSPGAMYIEAHEEYVQHIEAGERRIRSLSLFTVMVAGLLSLLYSYQIVYPLWAGQKEVTVNVGDPSLIAVEVLLVAFTLAWLVVGLRNYRFATRLGRMVRAARAAERELERKLAPSAH